MTVRSLNEDLYRTWKLLWVTSRHLSGLTEEIRAQKPLSIEGGLRAEIGNGELPNTTRCHASGRLLPQIRLQPQPSGSASAYSVTTHRCTTERYIIRSKTKTQSYTQQQNLWVGSG
jgi:hypothetical protein